MYKVMIYKVLADILKEVLPLIIDKRQISFLREGNMVLMAG